MRTRDRAKGRLKRLIREVRVVEEGGLDLLLTKNWGEVMDEVDISEAQLGRHGCGAGDQRAAQPKRPPPN